LLALVVLTLRLIDLGHFVTIDEAKFWIPRSERFLQAIQAGEYASIPVVGHPGVTTMWLGSAGIALRRLLFESGILQSETYATLLMLHRLPVVLVHAAGVLVGYGLLRRMLAPAVALLAALLWATDPFVLAFSRILHTDALAGTFATLSLLAACVYWNHTRQTRWLLLSALCAALAILSKSPALAVLPVVTLLALVAPLGTCGQGRTQRRKDAKVRAGQSLITIVKRRLLPLLAWGGVCLAALVLLWPLFWVNPSEVWQAFRYGIESEGGEPHMWGNFFLGRPVDVPGPLFYPVALAMRTTPWSLVGLLLLPFVLYGGNVRAGVTAKAQRAQRSGQEECRVGLHVLPGEKNATSPSPTVLRDLAVLAVFVLLFVLAMSLFAKKMNRYLVPVFPALDILAAAGLLWSLQAIIRLPILQAKQRFAHFLTTHTPTLATLVIGVLACGHALWWLPYNVAYFNQALGGAQAGARTFLAGWGEGFAQVANWINQQPDSSSVVTVTSLRSVLSPYLHKGVYATADEQGDLPGGAGYLVVYLSQLQRGLTPPYDHFYAQALPLHTVVLHGVPYAWIYQVPRPMEQTLQADFGTALQLNGYALDTTSLRQSGTLTLTLQWYTQAPLDADYHLFVHVFDAAGEHISQLDVPLLNPRYGRASGPVPTSAWQPGRYVLWTHPLHIPVDAEPHWIALGVYHPATFARLPVTSHEQLQMGTPDDGENALFLPPLSSLRSEE
jgi:4-amino-4-deoxy-L-arabinose transferase-like glycosyltransferase